MSQIIFDNPFSDSFCILPRNVGDFLHLAGERELKTLMLVLTKKEPLSFDALKSIGLDLNGFNESIEFWRKCGVLPALESEFVKTDDEIPQYPIEVVSKNLEKNKSMQSFLQMCEFVLQKTLTANEMTILYGICDFLNMTPETVIMLIEYCVSTGKKNIKYIEKTAVAWSKKGITTHDTALEHLKGISDLSSYLRHTASLLSIKGRELSPTEQKYILSWSDMGMSDDQILSAYDKTLTNTGKLSFPYMNTILKAWKENGEKGGAAKPAAAAGKPAAAGNIPGRFDFEEYRKRYLENLKAMSKKG